MVDSISKTRVDRGLAAAIVDAAFGPGVSLDGMTDCTDGWFNAVHRLALSDGTACVLKIAPPPGIRVLRYEHDVITAEVEALRLVADRTDLPVPAVLAWDPDRSIAPSPYFLMEECPGVALNVLRPSLDPEAQAGIDRRLVELLASMNSIVAPTFGLPRLPSSHDERWSHAFGRLVDDLLADAADAAVELPLPAEAFSDLVRRFSAHLDVVTTPRLVHWDLWDPNVFVDPETLHVVGIIDFERVLWADPLMEAQFLGKRSGDALVEAYGTPLLDQPGAVERRCLYDIYLYLVMTIESAYRNYPTDDIEQLGRFGLGVVLEELSLT